MDPLTITAIIVSALILLAMLWWYYPYFRKPWTPKLRALKKLRISLNGSDLLSAKDPALVVCKARRELQFRDGEKLLKTYPIALGLNPVDDKRKEGDGCTPEGDFYVCTKNDQSRFHLFLGLSYPNEEDAERGLRTGLLSKQEHDQILQAHAARKRPPWNTRLGGELGIHGGGSAEHWTQGGIAMENKDIEELFLITPLGAPVKILP